VVKRHYYTVWVNLLELTLAVALANTIFGLVLVISDLTHSLTVPTILMLNFGQIGLNA